MIFQLRSLQTFNNYCLALYQVVYMLLRQGRNGGRLSQGAGVTVAVRRRDLPSSFDQLLMLVLNTIGPFTSYSTSAASRIRLIVSPQPGR